MSERYYTIRQTEQSAVTRQPRTDIAAINPEINLDAQDA